MGIICQRHDFRRVWRFLWLIIDNSPINLVYNKSNSESNKESVVGKDDKCYTTIQSQYQWINWVWHTKFAEAFHKE